MVDYGNFVENVDFIGFSQKSEKPQGGRPSTEDINVTFRLVKSGKILDIEVLDHIIIGDGIYKSFKQAGLFSNNATSLPWLESEGR